MLPAKSGAPREKIHHDWGTMLGGEKKDWQGESSHGTVGTHCGDVGYKHLRDSHSLSFGMERLSALDYLLEYTQSPSSILPSFLNT